MATYHQEGQMQLPRADAIRSRLIDTFSLIEHLQGLSQAVPRHTVRELLDPSRQKKLMWEDQQQLVRFSIKPQHTGQISQAQRLLSKLHIRCSQRPPLSLWAGWVLECPLFTNFIIFLIFLNTIVLMVEIELLESTNTKLWPLKLALEVAAWFILFIFILEIILMWLSSFSRFWKNAWNVFDFVVTMLSLLPEVVLLAGVTGQPVWLQFLRICRVLRSLKLFARFRQIRVIILALVRALKSMTFLLMLLLIFFYIFAVAGVYFFVEYTRSPRQDLEYHMFFSRKNVSREALRSTHGKTDDSSRGAIQQKESLDLSEVSEVESIYETTEADVITSASKPEETLSNKKEYHSSSSVSSTSSSDASSSESRFSESVGHLDWETLVHENLPGLMEMDQDDRVWPRDSLFRYFELLEKLQYNLEERKKLQDFAVQALMNLEDK
ncbi:cation channel sperm-associated protein 2 isoform X3 [Cebus imitator]|uniref:cation channel sperm-associated protein 2 isoform X3 n=1 Tax=Cebus imitator TaxID=2715852 RepID=UPI00080A4DD2|nr:cation channel sperm-associated protein 2 isoform X3 [Cebus imitator]